MNLSQELLTAALEGLQAQRARLETQIADVRRMMGVRRGRPPKHPATAAAPAAAAPKRKKRRKLSAEARKRMAEAQQRRWAAVRAVQAAKGKGPAAKAA